MPPYIWMPPVHAQHKESMLCQTKGVSICIIHLDAPCMLGCPQIYGGIQRYEGHPNMGGVQIYGGVQTYRGHPDIWGHPNI